MTANFSIQHRNKSSNSKKCHFLVFLCWLSVFEKKLESRRNPARIPPQTPPAGGKSAEARRIHSPRQIVSPCLVRISIFNHLDFARKTFELCPTNTASALLEYKNNVGRKQAYLYRYREFGFRFHPAMRYNCGIIE